MITEKFCPRCRKTTKHFFSTLKWHCISCEVESEEEEKKFRKEHNLRKEE